MVGVQQKFRFPTVYSSQSKVNKAQVNVEENVNNLTTTKLEKELRIAYYKYQYAKQKETVFAYLDSLYLDFAKKANRKFEVGESNYLEKITAQAKQKQLQLDYSKANQDVIIAYNNLKAVVQTEQDFEVKAINLEKLTVNKFELENNVGLSIFESQKEMLNAQTKLAKQQLLPDLSLEYFQGHSPSLSTGLYGYQIGIGIPLFFGATKSKIKAAKISNEIVVEEENNYKTKLIAKYEVLTAKLKKQEEALRYYKDEGNVLAKEIIRMAQLSYDGGEIDIFKYLQSIENASQIKLNYLQSLNDYNQIVIAINYLTLQN